MCFTLDQYILVEMALVRSSDRLVLYDNDRGSVITINKIGATRVVKVEMSMGKNMEMSRLTFEHKVDPRNTGCQVVSVAHKGKHSKSTDITDGVFTKYLPVFRGNSPATSYVRVALYGHRLSADDLCSIHVARIDLAFAS